MANPKKYTFAVSARVDVLTDVEIKAESWEDALAQARELKMEDFVTLSGDYLDGDGVTLDSIWLKGNN